MESSTSPCVLQKITRHLLHFILLLLLAQTLCLQKVTGADISTCTNNCTGVPEEALCANDGRTYSNRCELRNARCSNRDLRFEHHGECTTPTPTPEILKDSETCSQHKQRILYNMLGRTANSDVWNRMCNRTKLQEKADEGTLTISDLLSCYRPRCTPSGEYMVTQCMPLQRSYWCWCSGPTGLEIDGTLSLKDDMPTDECNRRSSCEYQGNEYRDGMLFQPAEHACGICECLDGNVTCFENYVPDVEGRLNATQVNELRDLLLQLFFFEYNHQDSVLVDIRKIHQYIAHISEHVRDNILRSKFNYYDSNGDGSIRLENTEENRFHSDLYQFAWCKHFLYHISDIIDEDDSDSITFEEWEQFFLVDHTLEPSENYASGDSGDSQQPSDLSRRSAQAAVRRSMKRSLQNRKKFYFVTL